MKRRSLASLLLLAAFSLPVSAQNLPFEGSDPSIRPQDDLFRFANGAWIKKTTIPNDKASYGTFTILDEQADRDVRGLLEEAAKHPEKGRDSQLIGNFYASLMDLNALDRLGTRPLKKEMAR
ncbi:MAG TPA: M13 family metallopeptidase N-terminal domain-containing protein, partial [Chroococcales cyanobacterium]